MDQYKALSFNSNWKEELVENVLWAVHHGSYDLCLIQELKGAMIPRMTNQELFPELFHYPGYPPVHASVKGELLLLWSPHFHYITTIPIHAIEVQIVLLRTSESKLVGIINCHLPDSKASLTYFTRFLYPQLLYALASLHFGTANAWGVSVERVDLLVFGGDFNQPHPDFVPLEEIAAIRGRLRPGFVAKSGLLLFLTRLFGLRNILVSSFKNWTFGHRVFVDTFFIREDDGVSSLNVVKFHEHFVILLDWLRDNHPQFDLLSSVPTPVIYQKVMDVLHWSDGFSFFLLRRLYGVYLQGFAAFSNLKIGDIYFIKNPGWTDSLFFNANAIIHDTRVGLHHLDPYPQVSDHCFIETWFSLLVLNDVPEIDNPLASWILYNLRLNSGLPTDQQLRYITGLFRVIEPLVELGRVLAAPPNAD